MGNNEKKITLSIDLFYCGVSTGKVHAQPAEEKEEKESKITGFKKIKN